MVHTSDDWDTDRCAINPDTATSKDCPKNSSVGGVARVRNLVAAVQLRATTGGSRLPDTHVVANGPGVGRVTAGVLAGVADALVAVAIVPRRSDLGGGRDREDGYGRIAEREDVDRKSFEWEVVEGKSAEGEIIDWKAFDYWQELLHR